MSYRRKPALGNYLVGQGHAHYGPGTSLTLLTRPVFAAPGLGCASCAGDCSSCSRKGMGLFETGFSPSDWGIGEWSVIGIGAYMLFSTLFTTGRAVKAVGRIPGERRKKKAARLRARASELTKKK